MKVLRQKGCNNLNPRKQWLKDFTKIVKNWKKDGEILLMADLNSTLGDMEIGMFLGEIGLHDLVGQKYSITQIKSHTNRSK
eukprot:11372803-Ditylum_brightwellii.AAC.1